MKETVDVSIITVNFNSLDEISRSIESIVNYTSEEISFEYIIVSNSKEEYEQITELQEKYLFVKYFEQERNLGFSKANNIGAKLSSGKYLFFLNPDTSFKNDVLSIFIRTIKEEGEIGLLGPSTFDNNNELIGSIKNDLTLSTLFHLMIPLPLFDLKNISGHYFVDEKAVVDVVNGSAMFTIASAFRKVGGMEESLFLYWEENDLCLRLRKLGYRVLYVPEAKILHTQGATTKRNFLKMELQKHISQKIFLSIHKPELLLPNRVISIIAYGWRTIVSIVFLNLTKAKQFGSILIWYMFSYR